MEDISTNEDPNFEVGFTTPPHSVVPRPAIDIHVSGWDTEACVRSGICKDTIRDFFPGASPPSVMLRQSNGDYHECGEQTCPFTKRGLEERQQALQSGHPSDGVMSGDHVRVDHRAFTRPVHVLVKLVLLGIDASLWGDLEKFSGTVVDRHELLTLR